MPARSSSFARARFDALTSALRGVRDLREAFIVTGAFAQEIFPAESGALYAHDTGSGQLTKCCAWGEPLPVPESFDPRECWAFRLGRIYALDVQAQTQVPCAHWSPGPYLARLCVPLLASGRFLGTLHVLQQESSLQMKEVQLRLCRDLSERAAMGMAIL